MKLLVLSRYGLGLALLLLLTRCQRVNPAPPKAEGFDAPLPPTSSYVAGSLTFQLTQLEEKINRELDPILVGKGAPGGKKGSIFPFRVARSGRVRIAYADQQLRFSTPLQLWIAKPFSGDAAPPDKPFCALDIGFQSPLTVTPNWRLASRVQFTQFKWIIKPEIRILGQEIELTDLAQRLLDRYQSSIEAAIDTAIYKELRLDQLVSPIWRDMQKPLLIDRQFGLWLLPKPVAVASSPITGTSRSITSHLGITFETKTELNPKEPGHTPTTLPTLQKRDQLPSVSDLRLTSSIPYADINRILALNLAKKPPKLALGTLTIKKVSVYGGQRSLIAKTEVSGLLNGTIYLRGRPEFDTLTNTLVVKNLDFDPGTSDVLSGLNNRLVHKGLVRLLGTLLTIPLGDDIAKLPQTITKAFAKGKAGEKTSLAIQNFRFTPQRIAIRPDGVQALIRVQSMVSVQVKKL